MDKLNLELTEIDGFRLPRIASCGIAIACSLYRMDEIGNTPQAVIYGHIQSMTVSDDLIVTNPKGRFEINSTALKPLSRLGGSNYSSLGDILSAQRPK